MRVTRFLSDDLRVLRQLAHLVTVASSTVLFASSAQSAEAGSTDPPPERPLDLRISTGLGAGSLDKGGTLAARAGFAADFWLSPAFALGAEVGVLGHVTTFDSSGTAWTFMPEVAYRKFLSPKSYVLLVGSVGYAQNELDLHHPCDDCDFLDFGDYEHVTSHSLGSSAQIGLVADPGPVLWGFALRGDFMGFPTSNGAPMHGAVTLNGLFGF